MRISLFIVFLSLQGFSGPSELQSPELGTKRSEGLQIKAKLDYEKKMRSHTTKPLTQKLPAPKPQPPPQPAQTEAPQIEILQSETLQLRSKNSVTCKNGNEVRDLTMEYKGSGCELFYVKMGQSTSQARQNNGHTLCESIYEKMKTTLEKTGFVCESKKD